MIELIQDLIEKKIEEAKANGEFENLPGAGKPINLDDDTFVPQELRVAHRVLKNAGVRPYEVELKIELESLRAELQNHINSGTNLSSDEIEKLKKQILEKDFAFNMAIERMQRTPRG